MNIILDIYLENLDTDVTVSVDEFSFYSTPSGMVSSIDPFTEGSIEEIDILEYSLLAFDDERFTHDFLFDELFWDKHAQEEMKKAVIKHLSE